MKVAAANSYGDSLTSDVGNGAYITFVPDAPSNFINNVAVTDAGVIGLAWDEGVSNGGSDVIDYRV